MPSFLIWRQQAAKSFERAIAPLGVKNLLRKSDFRSAGKHPAGRFFWSPPPWGCPPWVVGFSVASVAVATVLLRYCKGQYLPIRIVNLLVLLFFLKGAKR